MKDKLKVGIVGCGAIAGIRHIPGFLRLKDKVELAAVCDRNESLAADTARKFGIPKSYPGLTEMLAAEKPDIIDICTPPQTHAAITIEALNGGSNVLLEKPMALKTSDCDEMLAAAKESSRTLGVIHNQLFYPPVIKARRMVNEGAIGDFIGMRILMSDPQDEMIMREDYWIHKLPGGVIGETGPHPVYKSIAFIGNVRDADVFASRRLEHPWAPFDEFRIEMEGEKGYSSILISYSSNRRASTIDILGTEGALHLDLLSMQTIYQGKNRKMTPVSLAGNALGTACRMVGGVAGNAIRVLTGQGAFYGHNTIISGYVDSIINGTEPPITGEDGRETTRALEMVVKKLQDKYGTD